MDGPDVAARAGKGVKNPIWAGATVGGRVGILDITFTHYDPYNSYSVPFRESSAHTLAPWVPHLNFGPTSPGTHMAAARSQSPVERAHRRFPPGAAHTAHATRPPQLPTRDIRYIRYIRYIGTARETGTRTTVEGEN